MRLYGENYRFTEHCNLPFLLHPTAVEPLLVFDKVLKVIRYPLYLPGFSYVIEHVPRALHTKEDIMTGWISGYHGHTSYMRRVPERIENKTSTCAPTSLANRRICPSRSTVVDVQKNKTLLPKSTIVDEDSPSRIDKNILVPNDPDSFKLKRLSIAQTVKAGCRRLDCR